MAPYHSKALVFVVLSDLFITKSRDMLSQDWWQSSPVMGSCQGNWICDTECFHARDITNHISLMVHSLEFSDNGVLEFIKSSFEG